MKKIVSFLGLIAACCAFAGCANKAASGTVVQETVTAQEIPAPVQHDYKGEVRGK